MRNRILKNGLLLVLLFSCEENVTDNREEEPEDGKELTVPEVAVSEVKDIMHTSVSVEAVIISNGGASVASRGFGWSKVQELPPENKVTASQVSGSGEFTGVIEGLTENTLYYMWAFAVNGAGTAYSDMESFTTLEITLPAVATVSVDNILANSVVVECNITGNGGSIVASRGVCWSKQPEPSVEDNKIEHDSGTGLFSVQLTGLQPNATYYVRAFAQNSKGVAYGEELNFTTNAKTGNITYFLHKASSPTTQEQEVYELITDAMDSAVWYYNHYTTITKRINVYYEPSVPTADGNSAGTIRFGSTASMNKVTAMHELAHTVGVGTSGAWSALISGGVYQGEHANNALRSITGNEQDEIHGDGQHFWPYGLNYVSEYQSAADLINHCIIVNAMKSDGL